MTPQEKILFLLYISPYHVSSLELQDFTSLNDRTVRKLIEQMREDGLCILSDAKGYYLPSTEEELEKYIRKTEKTAKSLFRSLESAKRVLREIRNEGQEKMPV